MKNVYLFISEKRISGKTVFTVEFAREPEVDDDDDDEEIGKKRRKNKSLN